MLYTADPASEIEARLSAVQVSDQPLELNRILKIMFAVVDVVLMFRGAQTAYYHDPDLADVRPPLNCRSS